MANLCLTDLQLKLMKYFLLINLFDFDRICHLELIRNSDHDILGGIFKSAYLQFDIEGYLSHPNKEVEIV